MENHDQRTAHSHGASTDERASSFNAPQAEPPLLSDCLQETLAERIADAADRSFPPGARKPRHDGFTPDKIADFLRELAATGVVEHAAAAVGLSAQAAYAFRNRRQGRAFARMWDAILINRSRARLAAELQARAVAGCVSVRKRDGVVVGEYHYYDNRLAMALLTRLDRLAEKEAASEAHLRALSEDMEEYIDCLAEGGDADAFVEARRHVESEPESGTAASAEPPVADDDPDLTRFARLAGCSDYKDINPLDIDIADLDRAERSDWSPDQWVRAYRSGLMIGQGMPSEWMPGCGTATRFQFLRAAAAAAHDLLPDEEDAARVETGDLDPACLEDWTGDQLARGWRSGILQRLPGAFWADFAEERGR